LGAANLVGRAVEAPREVLPQRADEHEDEDGRDDELDEPVEPRPEVELRVPVDDGPQLLGAEHPPDEEALHQADGEEGVAESPVVEEVEEREAEGAVAREARV